MPLAAAPVAKPALAEHVATEPVQPPRPVFQPMSDTLDFGEETVEAAPAPNLRSFDPKEFKDIMDEVGVGDTRDDEYDIPTFLRKHAD